MATETSPAQRYGAALLRDPDFKQLLEHDLRAERDGTADKGLTKAQFLAKYRDLLNLPPE